MGNWKALFVSVFSTLLLGCCLVPAFAEDAAITNQNGSSAIAMEQLNVPDDASGVHSALDDVSDSEASDTTDVVTPEMPGSVYDLASEHADDLVDGLYTFGSSVDSKFMLDVPVERQVPVRSCNCTEPTIRMPRSGMCLTIRMASLLSLLSRAARWMFRAEEPVTEILFSFGPITGPLRNAGLQSRKPTAAIH